MTWQEYTAKCTVQISTHNTAQSFWKVWLNGWVFVYELSGCVFESSWSHLINRCYKTFLEANQLENEINHLENNEIDIDSIKRDKKRIHKKE